MESLKENTNIRELFDSLNDALFIIDIQSGLIIDVNQKTCDLTGYNHEELIKMEIAGLSVNIPPYTIENANQWISRANNGQPQLFDWHVKHKNGNLFWLEFNMLCSKIDGEKRIVCLARDITNRKQTEDSLRENEEKFRIAFNNAPTGMSMILPNGQILKVNPMYCQMFGYSEEELLRGRLRKPCGEPGCAPREDRLVVHG